MFRYYASFIPGLKDFAADIIRERLDDVRIQRLLDGAVLFETACSYDRLNFFCFNNIFTVISVMEDGGTDDGFPGRHMKAVQGMCAIPDADAVRAGISGKKPRGFRIVCSRENRPAAMGERIRAETETFIARKWGLEVNRSRPDTEFWFLHRSEGFSVFMRRRSRRPSWEKSLHPGELPPPLAWTLCRLAGLEKGGRAADPFCGYGAIPHEALRRFPVVHFYAADSGAKEAAFTKNRLRGVREGSWSVRRAGAGSLPTAAGENTLDAIVTDPPWGVYKKTEQPPGELYRSMLRSFAQALKSGGRAVILASRETFEEIPGREGLFEIAGKIPILLSGRKAAIHILRKI
ncbi:MAG: methyltransferase [Treponema sp.]|jgi:hypothetical protein|nr:methyltransferase [Treponema sp.]